MKKLIVLGATLAMIIGLSVPIYAADVVITITIPEAQVARIQEAVKGGWHCKGADAKTCLKKYLIDYIKNFVKGYERTIYQQGFQADYQDLEAN